jgi:hypothetical protein
MKKNSADIYILFKHAVSFMSASILFIAIGTPQIVMAIGIVFAALSMLFLIAAFGQIIRGWKKFTDYIINFGDDFTFTFILVSILSIMKGWATLLNAHNETEQHISILVDWVRSRSPSAIIIWIYLFFLCFIIVSLVAIYQNSQRMRIKFGSKDTITRLIIMGIPPAALGVILYTHAKDWLWIPIWMIVTVLAIWYISKKNKKTRMIYMANKEKAKESAYNLVSEGKFVYDVIQYDYESQQFKNTLDHHIKKLEDEIQALRLYTNSLN